MSITSTQTSSQTRSLWWRNRWSAVAVAAVAATLVGCGSGESATGQSSESASTLPCNQGPVRVQRVQPQSLAEYAAASSAIVEFRVTSRDSKRLTGSTDSAPEEFLASAEVLQSVTGNIKAGDSITIFVSYGENGRKGGLTRPGLDAALQPGVQAIAGLNPGDSSGGAWNVTGGNIFVTTGDELQPQGPACQLSSADVALRTEVQRMTARELLERLSS